MQNPCRGPNVTPVMTMIPVYRPPLTCYKQKNTRPVELFPEKTSLQTLLFDTFGQFNKAKVNIYHSSPGFSAPWPLVCCTPISSSIYTWKKINKLLIQRWVVLDDHWCQSNLPTKIKHVEYMLIRTNSSSASYLVHIVVLKPLYCRTLAHPLLLAAVLGFREHHHLVNQATQWFWMHICGHFHHASQIDQNQNWKCKYVNSLWMGWAGTSNSSLKSFRFLSNST